jgi:hypothetical protein
MTTPHTHPSVQAYKINKARYDADNALVFIEQGMKTCSFGECGELLERPEFRALMATVTTREPFADIEAVVDTLGYSDLRWLEIFLPTCKLRRRVQDLAMAMHDAMTPPEKEYARRVYSVHNSTWVEPEPRDSVASSTG